MRKRTTKREEFLEIIEEIIPWSEWVSIVTPYYPLGKRGRPPKFMEHRKSSVRCKVEHPFLIIKRQFGYSKVRYRGIAKNLHRLHMLFAGANLLMLGRTGRKLSIL